MINSENRDYNIFDSVKVEKMNPKILQDFFIALELYYGEIHPKSKNNIKVHYDPIMDSFEPVAYTPLEKGVLIRELRPLFAVNKLGRTKINGKFSFPVRPLSSFLKTLEFGEESSLEYFIYLIDEWPESEDKFLEKGENIRFLETKGYNLLIDFYKKWEELSEEDKTHNTLELLNMDNKLAGKTL